MQIKMLPEVWITRVHYCIYLFHGFEIINKIADTIIIVNVFMDINMFNYFIECNSFTAAHYIQLYMKFYPIYKT